MSLSHDTLKALHEAATPGEWRLAGKCVPECWMTENEEGDFIAQCQDRRGFASLDAVGNNALIAYLCSESTRTEILTLIAERDARRGECIGQAVEDEAKRLWDATPTSGSQDYYGCEWSELSERSRDKFRLQALGEFRALAATSEGSAS